MDVLPAVPLDVRSIEKALCDSARAGHARGNGWPARPLGTLSLGTSTWRPIVNELLRTTADRAIRHVRDAA
jgi:hypothetical protein